MRCKKCQWAEFWPCGEEIPCCECPDTLCNSRQFGCKYEKGGHQLTRDQTISGIEGALLLASCALLCVFLVSLIGCGIYELFKFFALC